MRLRIVIVGKLDRTGLGSTVETYVERSRRFLPIEVATTRDTAAQWARARGDEGPNVLLDERGEQISTPQLADWLKTWRDTGVRHVDFLIGDAHGYTDRDRQAADRLLALSRLTLPHRLATVLLAEQLYRAGTILAGHPYHHG